MGAVLTLYNCRRSIHTGEGPPRRAGSREMVANPAAKPPQRPGLGIDGPSFRALAAELPEHQVDALAAIVAAPAPWAALGREHARAVGELVEAGVIVEWVADAEGRPLVDGPFYTLAPHGAARLGLALDEPVEGRPEWVRVGQELPPIRLPREGRVGRMDHPELLVDRAPGPEMMLLIDEATNEPIRLFGHVIEIDDRIKAPKRGRKGKGRRRAG